MPYVVVPNGKELWQIVKKEYGFRHLPSFENYWFAYRFKCLLESTSDITYDDYLNIFEANFKESFWTRKWRRFKDWGSA